MLFHSAMSALISDCVNALAQVLAWYIYLLHDVHAHVDTRHQSHKYQSSVANVHAVVHHVFTKDQLI